MGLLDYLFGNNKEKKRQEQELFARERERRLEESHRKEQERQVRIKAEREHISESNL